MLLFTASLALLDYVYQRKPDAVQGAAIRKAMGVMRGEGWVDAVEPASAEGKERLERKETEEDVLGESPVLLRVRRRRISKPQMIARRLEDGPAESRGNKVKVERYILWTAFAGLMDVLLLLLIPCQYRSFPWHIGSISGVSS